MPTLLIHARRGLFQLTKCQSCGHTFECENCTAKLTTYRKTYNYLELVCHQCQSYYKYPTKCPKCGKNKVDSKYGGIENLVELLENSLEKEVIRLDLLKDYTKLNQAVKNEEFKIKNMETTENSTQQTAEKTIFVTTRIYDPAIPYNFFDKVVFIQAENLLASPDYLVQEEVIKSLGEIFLQLKPEARVIFDTNTPEISFFSDLKELANPDSKEKLPQWLLSHLQKEKINREKYDFPPFKNLLLLTTQEKTHEMAIKKLQIVYDFLHKSSADFPEITFTSPYVAKFLKRKNLFSYHLLLKFPRNYASYNKLQKTIRGVAELYKLQVRLNPKHLF